MRSTHLLLTLLLIAVPLLAAFDDHPHPMREAEARRKAMAAEAFSLAREDVDPNQQQYDTRYIDLDMSFDTIQHSVDGSILIRVTVTGDPISTLVLDLDDVLNVDAVGLAATSSSALGDRITLTLDRTYDPGETFEVTVDWSGIPNSNHGAFGFTTADGKPLIWSLSEPFGARTWFPIKDTPSDKADSASIRYTVPKPMIAVSNGTLEQVVDLGTHQRFEWKERYPIAIYLISIAAHDYTEQSRVINTDAGPLPLVNWSYASSAASAFSNLDFTEQMVLAFEDVFGPYPFMGEKYAQVQFNWGGGMEHQTATSLCCYGSEGLTAHELAHQWFGDRVTCDSFTEVWVNEGFATYGEALWREATEGWAGYIDEMLLARYYGPGTIRVPESDLNDFGRVFNSGLSYDKASWVIHMLRGVMGDADFFTFLQAYLTDPALSYGTATTADVQRVAEQVSGLDLQNFFDQWIDAEYYPTYVLNWNATDQGANWDLEVQLSQVQTHQIYDMPVPIRVTTTAGDVDLVVDSDEPLETVVFPLADEPLSVALDPDHWILSATEPNVPAPTFDRGILLVNGVDIDVYGAEITTLLSDSSATGLQPFEFWNVLGTPAGGYPAGLPAPRGTGDLPPEILGEYSTVVWLGNDYNGDASTWIDAAILDFLGKGGNVVLLSRLGASFLTLPRLGYLGGTFAATEAQTSAATAEYPGLVNMGITNAQTLVDPLESTLLQPESTVLFRDSSNPAWVTGVWRHPAGGGSLRTGGGHFVYLAGRPYRWGHGALRANMEFILTQIIGEPDIPTAAPPILALRSGLTGVSPNPFNPRIEISFAMQNGGPVEIEVFDLRGRRVKTLVRGYQAPGKDTVIWDGTDASGQAVASGVYMVRFHGDGTSGHEKITLLR